MFPNAVKLFTIMGFDVKAAPSWILIVALIVWSLSTGYFPQVMPGAEQATYVILAVVATLAFFGSLVLHELAHSVVARRYGVPIEGITLFIFGGVAEMREEPPTAGTEFWIAIAGPLMSLALAFSFWVLSGLSALTGASVGFQAVLSYLALLNFILAVFNLLPAFPLDGGRVYRAILWNRSGNLLEATQRAAHLGTLFAYVLIGLGFLGLFSGAQGTGLWQILVGLFLLAAARSTLEQQLMNSALVGRTVANMMTAAPHVTGPERSLADLVERVMLRHGVSFVPVVENGVLLGYVEAALLSRIDGENWATTSVGDVFVTLDDSNTLAPDMPADAVMDRITETGRRKFLVAQGNTLLGVLSLSDLLGYLAVLRQIGTGGVSAAHRGGAGSARGATPPRG